MSKKTIEEQLTQKFMEASTEDRERKFEKILKKDPTFQRLSRERDALEAELKKQFNRLATNHPDVKKGADDYDRGAWRKHL